MYILHCSVPCWKKLWHVRVSVPAAWRGGRGAGAPPDFLGIAPVSWRRALESRRLRPSRHPWSEATPALTEYARLRHAAHVHAHEVREGNACMRRRVRRHACMHPCVRDSSCVYMQLTRRCACVHVCACVRVCLRALVCGVYMQTRERACL